MSFGDLLAAAASYGSLYIRFLDPFIPRGAVKSWDNLLWSPLRVACQTLNSGLASNNAGSHFDDN
jgi:hypothetical protein